MKKIILLFLFFIIQEQYAQNAICFVSPQVLSVPFGSQMKSTAKADFNGDGLDDIFSESLDGFAVLLSNGVTSFSAQTNFTLGISTNAVITEDFNNDGKADIAATSLDSNQVIVILGTGIGTILSINTFSVGIGPRSLTSGDFNNDGKLDVAVANYTSNDVYIYNGLGNGTFTFVANYSTGTNPSIIIKGDFNNDTNLDLLINSANASYILQGNGTSLFSATTNNNLMASNLVTADINNDSKLDLIYTNLYGSAVHVSMGNGNYTFNPATSYSISSGYQILNGLYAEDFNNDGKIDITSTSYNLNWSFPLPCNLDVLTGQGTGLFTGPTTFSVANSSFTYPFGFIPVDADNDGKLDIVAARDNSGIIEVLYSCQIVGIKESFENENIISIFPNPANDKLNLLFNSSELKISKAQIINTTGQVVKEIELNNNTQINIEDLPNGVYLLKLKQNGNNQSEYPNKRFVIEK